VYNNIILGGEGETSRGVYDTVGSEVYNNIIDGGTSANTSYCVHHMRNDLIVKNNIMFISGPAINKYGILRGAVLPDVRNNDVFVTGDLGMRPDPALGNVSVDPLLEPDYTFSAHSPWQVTTGGLVLGPPFDSDMNGDPRTPPHWSMGAFEDDSGIAPIPLP
jgi:hypothetical protein